MKLSALFCPSSILGQVSPLGKSLRCNTNRRANGRCKTALIGALTGFQRHRTGVPTLERVHLIETQLIFQGLSKSMQKIPSFVKNRPRTRIVCTIGPATGNVTKARALIRAGMSVARLNLSHGEPEEHFEYVRAIRQAAEDTGVPIGILADLPGPKYRIGTVDPELAVSQQGRRGILVAARQHFVLTADRELTTNERGTVWPAGLHNDIKPRSRVLIDEGAVEMRVNRVVGNEIHCTVRRGGMIQSDKAVTAPGNTSTLQYFTDETIAALDFAVQADVDFVGLSYIRDRDDLIAVREWLKRAGREPALVAKIEIKQAVDNLVEILDETDAIMVARGDLGVEMPLHLVPTTQKRMIRLANEVGKPVITATQMLETMRDNPYPTRAESTDVYNAVRDGTDAVMLSAETSVGNYPVAAVQFMARVSKIAEKYLDNAMLRNRRMSIIEKEGRHAQIDSIIAFDAARTADTLRSKAIITFTESGTTPDRVAAFRPRTPVIALSPDVKTLARLSMRWGVISLPTIPLDNLDQMFEHSSDLAQETGFAKDADTVVLVAGVPIGFSGSTNLLRVIKIGQDD